MPWCRAVGRHGADSEPSNCAWLAIRFAAAPPQVQYPDGRQTLCLMPARFNKKLWVRRGGFLIIEDAAEAAEGGGAVTGAWPLGPLPGQRAP